MAEILGGAVLAVYSALTALVDARRLKSPTCLVIERNGFAMLPGDRTVAWDEVETISDPRSTAGEPGTLRPDAQPAGRIPRAESAGAGVPVRAKR